jgi:hypothetical protein
VSNLRINRIITLRILDEDAPNFRPLLHTLPTCQAKYPKHISIANDLEAGTSSNMVATFGEQHQDDSGVCNRDGTLASIHAQAVSVTADGTRGSGSVPWSDPSPSLDHRCNAILLAWALLLQRFGYDVDAGINWKIHRRPDGCSEESETNRSGKLSLADVMPGRDETVEAYTARCFTSDIVQRCSPPWDDDGRDVIITVDDAGSRESEVCAGSFWSRLYVRLIFN